MSSPKKKRTTTKPNPSLPHDLLLSCIARVSRLYYPTLSLVSKSFRSLLISPKLYKTRSLLGHTESCIYVCLRFPPDPNPRWFTLGQVPNRMKKENSSGNRLVPIQITSCPHSQSSNHLVAVGSNIYNIGGDEPSSSRVSVLDCKSHTWNQAPSMRVDRSSSSSTVSLIDGIIYVAGGCEARDSVNWVESFDPKTQTWSSVTSPSAEMHIYGGVEAKHKSIGLEGNFYLFGLMSNEIYNPKEGRWNSIGFHDMAVVASSNDYTYCVIDNVLFVCFNARFLWYDNKVNLWKGVNGLEVLPEKLCKGLLNSDFEGLPDLHKRWLWHFKMVDYGGKMVVLVEEEFDCYQENIIWCAEIKLERRDGDEIWGKVDWFDVVLTVPKSCHLLNNVALSVTL